jgi:uncharacterized protein (DUF1015 family)
MTQIKPFRALIYNQEKIKDISLVVCPPYDVISLAKQQYYHDLDAHNLIHVIFGKEVAGENKYLRSAKLFREWVKNEILTYDINPAIYFYSQQYKLSGESKTRFGLIALLRLDDKKSCVFGHEHTRLEPKTDRLNLIRQVKANLSPIFVIFSDKKRIIRKCQDYARGRLPLISVTDDDKVTHDLWRIDEPGLLDKIQEAMQKEQVFIADGHHRYEVACNYRDEIKKDQAGAAGDNESTNYIMSYFTNTDSRGLSILPIHRLIKLPEGADKENLISSLKEYFQVEEIDDKAKLFLFMQKAGNTEHVLGMYCCSKYWLLRLKNVKILDKTMGDKPKEYRSLDVAILNAIVFNKILNLNLEDKDRIAYSHNTEEFIKLADKDKLCIVFFLNPVKIEQIIAVALKGEKMPAKSTFFYPKVLSGLTIHKHEA